MSKHTTDKEGVEIHVGDEVTTQFRGGKREGKVEKIIVDEQDLKDAGDLGVAVKNPPKVVFTDQHGHKVSHNPGTLRHVDKSSE